MVVAVIAGDGFELALAYTGALGAELGALVAQAGDDAPLVQIQRVHEVGGVDVFTHVEVADARLFVVPERARIQATNEAFKGTGVDARPKAAQAIVNVAALEVGQGQVIEVIVSPDIDVVGLVASAELAAEFELRGVALDVVLAGQVQADILFLVAGIALFPLHLIQLEAGGIVEGRIDSQTRLSGTGKTYVSEVAFEGRAGDAARVALTCLAVAGLSAKGPEAHHPFAAEHVGLDGLGFLAGLDLAPALGIAQLAGQLRIFELDPGGISGFGVLEAAIEGAQVVAAEIVGLVVEVQADTGAFAGDLIVALLELL